MRVGITAQRSTTQAAAYSRPFRNDSGGWARLPNFNTPAGREDYMRDLAEAAESGPLTPDVIARVASRYDFEFTR